MQDRIEWLHARVLAVVLLIMVVSIVGGFVGARFIGLPVKVELFYSTVVPVVFLILGRMTKGDKTKENDENAK